MDEEQSKHLKPLFDYLAASNKESDRGRVLVAVAQVDTMLEDVLRAIFSQHASAHELFSGPNAPLSSLFNKTNASRALGLINDDEYEAIGLMRKIRNDFAHTVHVDFDSRHIMDRVMNMRFGIQVLIQNSDPAIQDGRTRFSMCATSLISSIYNRAHYVSKERRTEKQWPQ